MTNTSTDSSPSEIFASLDDHRDQPDEMLDQAIEHFRQSRRAMEMFEAMKMRVRHRLGLPLIVTEHDSPNSDAIERQLEAGLLDACRAAGAMLIEDGHVGEGWMYLRPVADLQLARDLINKVEINEENYDEMLQVLLHEGVDVGRGFQAILENQGTCNSITLFEQQLVSRSKSDRSAAAARLLDHFYSELLTLVLADVENRDQENPKALKADGTTESLAEIVQSRPWLLQDSGYHLDTTHLAATVRIASVLETPEQWEKARELAVYGRKLDHRFQYPGEEPFKDFYPTYAAYYDVLLGNNVEAGLKLFERKARTMDVAEHGTTCIETYVDLLDRVGRQREAIEVAISLVPADIPAQRIVPMLLEIAGRATDVSAFDPILNYCQSKDDVLGYAAVLHAKAKA
ncbi:hypothetical protein Pla22_01640 [Rubripirellula amarantea]|uniref:Uncharacterized protein n=1 Tax=Rubripirellula amarantea TaxID=2527999 RepID=A0A5C5WQ27_9BACT|nr:hypothetical protein [Rubripirellula amarantea]TWT52540.1 hypothetical protein Pla22_01640 [Rubripirellula amarantea]